MVKNINAFNSFLCITLPKCCKDLKPTKVLGGNVLNLQKLMVKDCKLWRDPKWSDLNWDSKKNTSEHWIFKSWTCSNPGSGTCIAAEDEFLLKSSIFNWHWTLVSALHSHLASIWGQILEAKVHTRKRPPMSLIFQTVAMLEPKRWEIVSIEVVLAFKRVSPSKNSSHHYFTSNHHTKSVTKYQQFHEIVVVGGFFSFLCFFSSHDQQQPVAKLSLTPSWRLLVIGLSWPGGSLTFFETRAAVTDQTQPDQPSSALARSPTITSTPGAPPTTIRCVTYSLGR